MLLALFLSVALSASQASTGITGAHYAVFSSPAPSTGSSSTISQATPGAAVISPSGASSSASPQPIAQVQAPALLGNEPQALLGATLAEIFAGFGVPDSVIPVRGPEAWQDDVCLHYRSGYSFFIYKDRVWQIRLDKDYKGPIAGVMVGNSQDKVLSLMGKPDYTTQDSIIYKLPEQGYPIRLRFVLKDGLVSEIYLYRSDF